MVAYVVIKTSIVIKTNGSKYRFHRKQTRQIFIYQHSWVLIEKSYRRPHIIICNTHLNNPLTLWQRTKPQTRRSTPPPTAPARRSAAAVCYSSVDPGYLLWPRHRGTLDPTRHCDCVKSYGVLRRRDRRLVERWARNPRRRRCSSPGRRSRWAVARLTGREARARWRRLPRRSNARILSRTVMALRSWNIVRGSRWYQCYDGYIFCRCLMMIVDGSKVSACARDEVPKKSP